MPNVVNLAKKTPATHSLIVRHRDQPGVLARVFAQARPARASTCRRPRTSSSRAPRRRSPGSTSTGRRRRRCRVARRTARHPRRHVVALASGDGPASAAAAPARGSRRRPAGLRRSLDFTEETDHDNRTASSTSRPARPCCRCPVLEEAQRDLVALPGVGMSVLEISHRSKTFEAIIGECEANIRKLAGIPENYHVLFLQGGATPAVLDGADEPAAGRRRRPTTSSPARGRRRRSRKRRRSAR